MGIAILVAVAALLAAFSGYLIKAAFVFSDIVMSDVRSLFYFFYHYFSPKLPSSKV